MIAVVIALIAALRSTIRSRAELATEVLALRHQLAVLRRQAPRRLRLRRTDRLLWVLLSRAWSEWRHAVQIVSPDTVVRWHRRGFALFWRWKSRPRGPGRPAVAADLRDLIRQMQAANPLWGAPRIYVRRSWCVHDRHGTSRTTQRDVRTSRCPRVSRNSTGSDRASLEVSRTQR